MIAISGYSRQGKDEAGKALIARGYKRVAFGDIIRQKLREFTLPDAVKLIAWMRNQGQPESERKRVWQSFEDMATFKIDLFTENDDQKKMLRALMEWYGMYDYDAIMDELFRTLPLPAVNTRLMRVREAQAWVDSGGFVIEVIRLNAVPLTDFERDTQQELRDSGLLSVTIINGGTIEDLHRAILDFAESSPTGYQPELAMF